jgi:hypothetical protein
LCCYLSYVKEWNKGDGERGGNHVLNHLDFQQN